MYGDWLMHIKGGERQDASNKDGPWRFTVGQKRPIGPETYVLFIYLEAVSSVSPEFRLHLLLSLLSYIRKPVKTGTNCLHHPEIPPRCSS